MVAEPALAAWCLLTALSLSDGSFPRCEPNHPQATTKLDFLLKSVADDNNSFKWVTHSDVQPSVGEQPTSYHHHEHCPNKQSSQMNASQICVFVHND